MIWTATESGVYFIAACLPYLRTLFTPLLGKIDFSYLNKLKLTMGTGTRKSAVDCTTVEVSPISTTLTEKPTRDDILLPRLSAGNDQRGLVACYHVDGPRPVLRLDTSAEDLEKGYGSERSEGIQVQRSYGISMMPRVHTK